MDKGFAIIFYFGNKKVVLFWERSLRRCRRGTQKLPGKRTGFGRRSEKAGRQRPTTEGATSQSGGNLSGNSTGAQNRKGRFCALFCCPKKETEERYSHHSEAMSSKGQILRSTPNTAPLICGAYNTQPEGLLTTA